MNIAKLPKYGHHFSPSDKSEDDAQDQFALTNRYTEAEPCISPHTDAGVAQYDLTSYEA
jgi:hypothetical protein